MDVVWFKRDLRVVDHLPLTQAALRGPVLSLIVIEPEWWRQPDMSARQFAFYRECVAELSSDISKLGARLIIRVGDIIDVLNDIYAKTDITNLWSHEETGGDWTYRRDMRVSEWCQSHSVMWTEFRQDGVIRRLRNRDGWSTKWNKLMAKAKMPSPVDLIPPKGEIESSNLPSANDLCLNYDNPQLRQKGGRSQALSTLSSFLYERGELYRAAMSSPITGEQACSRVSPYLAWGVISMREIAQMTWKRQRELNHIGDKTVSQWRGSLASFTGRLHWHCHFMQKLEDEPNLEFCNMHRAYDALRRPKEINTAYLSAWQKGETGLPFVDACMRYLIATGWLNFRMRAMLISTASYHLWLHWRLTGLHLARKFLDYEAGIHWPQTQMQSGTTGINTVRIYNPVKQGYDQDPDGVFVRRWVPELAAIKGGAIHEPWRSSIAADILDKTYPLPIIDHMEAAREARKKIYAARKSPEFQQMARAIQTKHGSRKSGIPITKKKFSAPKKSKLNTIIDEQLSMPLVSLEIKSRTSAS
ncbi:MAG: Cryptochrome-like protein cry2 [Hyphomicrobiaceae bacterium hypho_1]